MDIQAFQVPGALDESDVSQIATQGTTPVPKRPVALHDLAEESFCNRYSIYASPEELSFVEPSSDDMEKYLNKPGFARDNMRLFFD